jgi:hypothetical protein
MEARPGSPPDGIQWASTAGRMDVSTLIGMCN